MKSMFKQTGTVPTETLFNNNKPLDVRGAYKGVINMYKQKLKELGNVDGLIKKCNIDIDLQQEFKDNSIKFIKGNSNIATDNSYINDQWTVPDIFTAADGTELTGIWIMVNSENQAGLNIMTLIDNSSNSSEEI